MTEEDLAALPLRERKKALTRAAIVAAAERLFEERGFDEVTVAEIADAANVSVKTLFVYFRSKEDLAFADTDLFDELIAALERRPAGTGHAQAIAAALIEVAQREEGGSDVEGFHRGYGRSSALESRLLRMWADLENRITAFLAAEAGTAPTPAMRLRAMQLAAIPRSLTSPEVLAMAAGLSATQATAALQEWLHTAASLVATEPGPAG